MTRTIDIKSKSQVQNINYLASEAPYEVWLSAGNVMLDARSLLGLFTLIGHRASVVVEDDVNPTQFERLVNRMAKNV